MWRAVRIRLTAPSGTIHVSAESLLYAGYAQHFLLTYFPAAYPRWYLDGFGQIFASFVVRSDDVLEFGRSPSGTSAVLGAFGAYPLDDVLSDRYLTQAPRKTGWTPVHAWLFTHFLLFSDTRRPQLRQYLALRANDAAPIVAAAVFGDRKQLARELRGYVGARKPYEQVSYPAGKGETPVIRRLTEAEAAFIKGRSATQTRRRTNYEVLAGRWVSAAGYRKVSGSRLYDADSVWRTGVSLICHSYSRLVAGMNGWPEMKN